MAACRVIVIQMETIDPIQRRNWCSHNDILYELDASTRSHRSLNAGPPKLTRPGGRVASRRFSRGRGSVEIGETN